MKKIICTGLATLATLTVCAAIEDKAAQVYDVKVSVKTTAAKSGKFSPASNPFITDAGTVVYRVSGSQSWIGVIWGCDCDAILGSWKVINQELGIVAGCAIWDKKSPYTIIFDENIKWRLLNAIDKKGTKVEGAWTIGDSSDRSKAFLAFAGFGTLTLDVSSSDVECTSYVKNISGNVAGWMPAPAVTTAAKAPTCTFCTTFDDGVEATVDPAEAWNFCACAEFGDAGFTAVSGTWSIKYNKNLSKGLAATTSIINVYKNFPSSVKSAVSAKISKTLADAEK